MMGGIRYLLFLLLLILHSSCGFKISSKGSNSSNIISGIISPFAGLIAQDSTYSSFLFSSAIATSCADPVYAKLFDIKTDGSIDDSNPLATQLVSADARYSFNLKPLGLKKLTSNVQYIVKTEGCNGDVYKRPVTNADSFQNIDVKSTIVAEVVNANGLVTNKLNATDRKQIEELIKSINGTTPNDAMTSLTTDSNNVNKFTQIFGVSPAAVQNAKPEVALVQSQLNFNELQSFTFSVHSFHINPNYSFAYKWKLDGVVKSSNGSWSYIPTADSQGIHQIDLYVGKNDGSGNIDTTKPFYTKTISISVNNNILPTAPDFALNISNPTPVSSSTVLIDLSTGVSLANCNSFSHLAITDTPLAPGIMQFNIPCSTSGTQTEIITFSSGDGNKTLFLWAIDSEGNISNAKTVNLILDTLPPNASLSFSPTNVRGGNTQSISLSANDAGTGLSSLDVYLSPDGGTTYSLISNLNISATSYSWTIPSIDATNAKIKLVAVDSMARITTVYSNFFVIDSTAPTAPVISRTSSAHSSSMTVSVSAICSVDYDQILYSQTATTPSLSNSGWETCNVTKNFMTTSGDGLKTIYAFTKDALGNISTSSNISMTLDTTAPTLSLTSFNAGGFFQGGSSQNITWIANDLNLTATPISISYSTDGSSYTPIATNIANSGSYAWTLPSIDHANVSLNITATDLAGNSIPVTSNNFTIDSTPPIVASFSLNSGVAETNVVNVLSSLNASDNISKITHFCYKNTTGTITPNSPLIDDACWVPVNSPTPNVSPSLNISFNNYYYALGLGTSTYNVYAWVKNEVGLISTISNSGSGQLGIDLSSVSYNAGSPPTVINIISVNSDSHQNPPIPSDQIVSSGQNLFIKWKASDVDGSLPADAINIYYTVNDLDYTLIASNLSNSANGACSVDGINYSGCYVALSPTSSYFKVRVVVKDSSLTTSIGNATPNNSSLFRILAGNMEPGIGGSATSAIFNVNSSNTVSSLPGSLVVADNGLIFLKDRTQGILKIDPQTGVVSKYIPITGAITDGAIGTASIKQDSTYMTLDYQNNLLLYDYDRIRKVNLTTNTVSTLVGGGATSASGTLASSFQAPVCTLIENCIIIPLPNGDIHFTEGARYFSTTKKQWKYQASNQRVYAIYPTGTGITGKPVEDDVSTTSYAITGFSLEFNPTNSAVSYAMLQLFPSICPGCGTSSFPISIDITSGNSNPAHLPSNGGNWAYRPAVTARNGLIYQVVKEGGRKLIRFNSSSNTYATVLGTGASGFCADGTDALVCNVNIQDAFVTSDSRIFFVDNGLIRTIDSSNQIRTLFGQRRNYGDGGLATSARLNDVYFFDFFSNDDIVILDNEESVIRKFTPNGNISLIAGNGSPSPSITNSLATETGIGTKWWGGRNRMLVDPGNNDIYILQNNNQLYRLNNSDQKIVRVVGAGGTFASSGDSLAGSSISFAGENAFLLGLNNNQIVISSSERNGSAQNYRCYAKFYDVIDSYRQSHFTGNGNLCSTTLPPTGTSTAIADIYLATTNYLLPGIWENGLGGWVLPRYGNNIQLLYVPGGTVSIFSTLPRAIQSYTVTTNASSQTVAYYCSTTGSVYKYNLSTATETLLNLPNSTYKCRGYEIKYKASRGSVVFPIVQNGLNAIAEIIDTP